MGFDFTVRALVFTMLRVNALGARKHNSVHPLNYSPTVWEGIAEGDTQKE